jgi:hypothetical protein
LSSIIIAVTAPVIIAIAWTIIEASPPVVIGWPAAIDEYGVVHVIIARRSAIDSDVKGRPGNWRRPNQYFSTDGIDTPSQRGEV